EDRQGSDAAYDYLLLLCPVPHGQIGNLNLFHASILFLADGPAGAVIWHFVQPDQSVINLNEPCQRAMPGAVVHTGQTLTKRGVQRLGLYEEQSTDLGNQVSQCVSHSSTLREMIWKVT